jgi:hypothetical protein
MQNWFMQIFYGFWLFYCSWLDTAIGCCLINPYGSFVFSVPSFFMSFLHFFSPCRTFIFCYAFSRILALLPTNGTQSLRLAQPDKIFAAFVEPEGSLPCTQKPASGPYPEPDESSSQTHAPFQYLIFGVLTAVKMSIVVFWVVTLYSLVGGYKRFRTLPWRWKRYVPPKRW